MAAGGRGDALDVASASLWLGLRESAQRYCGLALEGARRVSAGPASAPGSALAYARKGWGLVPGLLGVGGSGAAGVAGSERKGPAPEGTAAAQKPRGLRGPGSAGPGASGRFFQGNRGLKQPEQRSDGSLSSLPRTDNPLGLRWGQSGRSVKETGVKTLLHVNRLLKHRSRGKCELR